MLELQKHLWGHGDRATIFSLFTAQCRAGSLKVITSVFGSKLGEEQKKVITSADVQLSAQNQVKSKKKDIFLLSRKMYGKPRWCKVFMET